MIQPLIIGLMLMCPASADTERPSPKPALIQATGIGRPPRNMTGPQAKLMARRAAEVVAVRNLAAKLHGRQIHDGTPGTAHQRIDALIRGYRYLPATELPDGTVEVTVELPLPTVARNHERVADEVATLRAHVQDLQRRMAHERERTQATLADLERRIDALIQELTGLRRALRAAQAEQSAIPNVPAQTTP